MKKLLLLLGWALSFGALAGYGDVDPAFSPFPGGCAAIAPLEDGGAYVDATSATQRVVARLDAHGIPVAGWGTSGLVAYGGPSFPRITALLRGNAGDLFIVDESGVVHVDAAGHIDTAYGFGGRTELGPVHSAALQGGNKLVALIRTFQPTGSPGQIGPPSYRFVRLAADGSFDQQFAGGGELLVPGTFTLVDTIYGWSVRGDGGVEMGTYRDSFTSAPGALSLAVISADLAISPGASGRVVPQGVASWMASTVKAEPTGALVIAGTIAKLTRFNADGSVDAGFGSQGVVALPNNLDFTSPVSLWREPSGEWTMLGEGTGNIGFTIIGLNQLRAVRFTSTGFPDDAFGKKLISPDGDHVIAHAPDGSILHVDTTCMLQRYTTDAVRAETSLIEYYHPALDHYFMTSSADEIVDLDTNVQPGWIRTGESFGAWSPGQLAGAVHVCRFYGDPVIGPNSHFYTGEDSECQGLIALDAATPKGQPAWHLEGRPFDIAIPVNGVCPVNLQPVYRLFNGIVGPVNGPNHRYTTDTTIYAAMQAKGWLPEGVHFCAPPRFN